LALLFVGNEQYFETEERERRVNGNLEKKYEDQSNIRSKAKQSTSPTAEAKFNRVSCCFVVIEESKTRVNE